MNLLIGEQHDLNRALDDIEGQLEKIEYHDKGSLYTHVGRFHENLCTVEEKLTNSVKQMNDGNEQEITDIERVLDEMLNCMTWVAETAEIISAKTDNIRLT